MTLARRAALNIMSWVVWLASPGCREWAEGLEREVAFIEGDWRALGWVIGSARVLLDRREAPIVSLEQASAVAKSYFESKTTRTFVGGSVIAALAFLLLSLLSLSALGAWVSFLRSMEPIGICVGIAALLYGGYLVYGYPNRPRKAQGPLDLHETVSKYRSELHRMQEIQHGRKGRLVNSVFYIYFSLQLYFFYRSEGFHELVQISPLIFLWVLAMLYGEVRFHQKGRANLRRIAELDALLARGAEGTGQ
jgi:hypothetical protein